MDDTLRTQIEAAEAYDTHFVPALFAQWVPVMMDLAHVTAGDRVLDVACGTGVLARAAGERVGPVGNVAGLDAAPGMLSVARRLAPEIDWHEGAAEFLPFEDGSFDVVVSQFGLMLFLDQQRAVQEMKRVLKPGGRVAVAVWDSLESMPLYRAEVDLLARHAGQEAADALRAPFNLGDPVKLATLFEDAGIDRVEVTTRAGRATFPDVLAIVQAELHGWLPAVGATISDKAVEAIMSEAPVLLGPHVEGEGPVTFDLSAHIVTGRRSEA